MFSAYFLAFPISQLPQLMHFMPSGLSFDGQLTALKHWGRNIIRFSMGVSLNFFTEILFLREMPTSQTIAPSAPASLNNAFTRFSSIVIEKSMKFGKMNFSVLKEWAINIEPSTARMRSNSAKYTTACPISVNIESISININDIFYYL